MTSNPKLDNEFSQQVADGVRAAIINALGDITAALSLTDDERHALENYRAMKAAKAQEAHATIVAQLNATR